MLQKEKMDNFISYALNKVYFYIESKFWSKLTIDALHDWIGNFKSTEEKYCALKLLDRFVYYSEEDIVRLLDFGINEIILKRKILDSEVSANFKNTNAEIVATKDVLFLNTYILPLMTDNLSESSLAMVRYLTNELGFPEDRILDLNKLKSEILDKAQNIIIVDDFIGSSNQLYTFWNDTFVTLDNNKIVVKHLKKLFTQAEFEYFCLVCTEDGLTNFHTRNDDVGLRITYCEMLTNKYKVFGKDSVYFNNKEVEQCKNVLDAICQKHSIDFLGYNSLDYAIAFHHSIPDSSLPLFYRQTDLWQPLFKNKKTIKNVTV